MRRHIHIHLAQDAVPKLSWYVYIPEEGDWELPGEPKNESEAREAALKMFRQINEPSYTLPRGARFWKQRSGIDSRSKDATRDDPQDFVAQHIGNFMFEVFDPDTESTATVRAKSSSQALEIARMSPTSEWKKRVPGWARAMSTKPPTRDVQGDV